MRWLYYIASDFGTSISKPFFIFLLNIMFFSLAFLFIFNDIDFSKNIDFGKIFNSILLSLKNSVMPFTSLRSLTLDNDKVNYLYYFMVVIEGGVSISTLGLIALAARTKFKRE